MPSHARKDTIPEGSDAYCHCISRCVRRAFLCGEDSATGKDYSYRREWFRQRLEELAGTFAIDLHGLGILENHYHLLLHLRPDLVKTWSDEEVVCRWLALSSKRLGLVPLDEEKVKAALRSKKKVAQFRRNLSSLSRFMWYLNEPIARMANREDKVKGRFFEERFRATRVDDLAGLLGSLVYIDLNEIRAGMAKTPEDSRYTSAFQRIQDLLLEEVIDGDPPTQEPSAAGIPPSIVRPHSGWLAPISLEGDGYDGAGEGRRASNNGLFDFGLDRYLEILDWTGRELRADKRGSIPSHLAPILERLRIRSNHWVELIKTLGKRFHRCIGSPDSMLAAAKSCGQRWLAGMKAARSAFT